VQVLVAGQVAPHDDEVQVLAVGRRDVGDRLAVGVGDGEAQGARGPRREDVRRQLEGVAVGRDGESTGDELGGRALVGRRRRRRAASLCSAVLWLAGRAAAVPTGPTAVPRPTAAVKTTASAAA
jgi:hypothetical protein